MYHGYFTREFVYETKMTETALVQEEYAFNDLVWTVNWFIIVRFLRRPAKLIYFCGLDWLNWSKLRPDENDQNHTMLEMFWCGFTHPSY